MRISTATRAVTAVAISTLGVLAQSNLVKPRIAGIVIASQFGTWGAHADGPILASGGPESATLQTPQFTLPDGTQFQPLAVGTPVAISGDGNNETVFPTAVNCAPGGGGCSFIAVFARPHPGHFTVSSATGGLQEALNAAGAGGWVLDDLTLVNLSAPLVIGQTVRLSGFSDMDANLGSRIVQHAPNTDVIQVGTASLAPSDVVIENLMAIGVSGNGSDSGVAIHCLNCAKLKLINVTAKQAHDGVFFDSSNGHAFDATVTASHFIADFYGAHIVGGSANRLTFVGNTLDGNQYGVFDDGGWVHTWVGNDIEGNALFGYWQQVSAPGAYSGHGVVLEGNYFENNGSNTAGQGDLFLGQLVNGGTGNNGAGCINCQITGNLFNAASGGNVTAISFGAADATVGANTYSGYAAGHIYTFISGPNPNFSHVLSLGDGADDNGASSNSGAFGGARTGVLSRIDNNGSLTLGGWDQLNDIHGSPLRDTTLESPTGVVSLRGLPGGPAAANSAQLYLDGNSTGKRGDSIDFRNQGTNEYQVNNDPFGSNSHDFCLLNDLGNPSAAQCLIYVNPQGKIKFSNPGPTGTLATRTQDYQFTQLTNGDSALVLNRATDSGNTGFLLDLEDATLSHPLFRVDTNGAVVAGSWNNSGSDFTIGALTATSATVGGNPVNTTSPRVGGQSGTLFASSTFTAGQCLTGGISFSSGVAMGMAVAVNPESTPPAGLVWNGIIDGANHVTIRVCNATGSSVSWSGGAVWDVRVLP